MASPKAYISFLLVVVLAVLVVPYGVAQDHVCTDDYSVCSMDATCVNATEDGMPEMFNCTCNEGFMSVSDACADIDECQVDDPCSSNATCNNTDGGVMCMCNEGFTGDGVNCENIDECTLGGMPCDENAMCLDMMGTYNCTCNPGFSGDGTVCEDIDECALMMGGMPAMDSDMDDMAMENMTDAMMDANMTDSMMDGNMTDDMPMPLSILNCDKKAKCINFPGGYDCRCRRGYNGNGFTCRLDLVGLIIGLLCLGVLLCVICCCCCIHCARRRALRRARNPLLAKPQGYINPTMPIAAVPYAVQARPQRIIVYGGGNPGVSSVPGGQVVPGSAIRAVSSGIYGGAAYGASAGGYQWTAQ